MDNDEYHCRRHTMSGRPTVRPELRARRRRTISANGRCSIDHSQEVAMFTQQLTRRMSDASGIPPSMPSSSQPDSTSLFSTVVEAERSLFSLIVLAFVTFAGSRRDFKGVTRIFVCSLLLMPSFMCLAIFLSGWVAVFASIGYLFLADDKPETDETRPNSPRLISRCASHRGSTDSIDSCH